ncbi:putative polysaccharide lyase family 8, N terminal alpha-helical domain [Lyophyllum shimeji]|uniref:Polysaccharide lyase family 8, N terminal alpha-helical domain n=1 Tax=Lyophyllum shimeji TaxID=47721 RepID=A0A9P3PHL3_LYOSH|nr:putative polysaccharide lyase family 8, N terminal alpha-helical domain [Lyophyllum shimeji]
MVEARADALSTIRERRITNIISGVIGTRDIAAWLLTLDANGKWPDSEVDYTTGCPARRANWPAQEHWRRIVIMASAWHGGLSGTEEFVGSKTLRNATSLAMDYWFSRDFTDIACLADGGKAGSTCTCDNPENLLWNTNWFSNVILIPKFVTSASLLLGNTLSSSQLEHMNRMATRSYEYNVEGMTGANALDVSRIAMDQALITNNVTLLTDAYNRSHKELIIMDDVKADGIRADGAFGQHDGMLYNGNYGKDYSNDLLGSEIEAAGSPYAANAASQAAFGTLFEGDTWMIYRNTLTNVLHWDFSALGRFITFPVADLQATASININVSAVGELGQLWGSKQLTKFATSLSAPSNVNPGGLTGNRMFYTNDYMVHRGQNYVSTLKMWSTRSRDSECTNSQNPFGFHLADGVAYNYIRGDEYEDISAAWDWNLIPGITTDYGATPLSCANTHLLGIETFVGGASDGHVGVAAMRYTNPVTKALKWQKAWFYLENDVQHVMVSGLSSTSGPGAPLISVLDQRRRNGPVIVDESVSTAANYTAARTLFHGGVGYKFSGTGAALSISVATKTGDWATIGTSTQAPVTVDLFAAWIVHKGFDASSLKYSVFPGTTAASFAQKARNLQVRTVRSDEHVSAIYDEQHETLMAVFWDAPGGNVTLELERGCAPLTVAVDGNAALIYKLRDGVVTLSDPSQSLSNVKVTLSLGPGAPPSRWKGGWKRSKTTEFALPSGGLAGNSVTRSVY